MASFTASPSSPVWEDAEIWHSLKQAIATSSGFQRWQLEHAIDDTQESSLDHRVSRYLRETLAALAY